MALLIGGVETSSSSNAPNVAAACSEVDQEPSTILRSEMAAM